MNIILGRYELASGESYFRQSDLGRALKKFLAVEKHYLDITEDQFDFHSYCLRKMTLRSYVEMLKFQDRLHSHAYFRKAAAGAIRYSFYFWTRGYILLFILFLFILLF